MPTHRVKTSQNLDDIARQYRIRREDIWSAPENSELRETRKDPDVLCAGDVLFVPEQRCHAIPVSTNIIHRFKLRRRTVPLCIRFCTGSSPHAGVEAVLVVDDGPPQQITLESDGILRARVLSTAVKAEVTLYKDTEAELRYVLELRALDPVQEPSGQKQRLKNLGFDDSPEALRCFQRTAGLLESGALDADTQSALREQHAR